MKLAAVCTASQFHPMAGGTITFPLVAAFNSSSVDEIGDLSVLQKREEQTPAQIRAGGSAV